MSNKYRTAHGKMLDIDKLRLVNEKTIAVGNMKVNARGDQLGQGGQVVATRNQVMNQQYKIQGTVISDNMPMPQQAQTENVAPDGESFDPPDFVETIKPVEPKLRGSLADSIAKQATVEQKTLDPNMHKPNGPKRI
jgi:hypothetical protein